MGSTGPKGSTGYGNAGGKGSTWEERVERCERKYAGGGTWSGHAQQDFGRGSAGQNRKYRELKEVQEKKKVWECGTRHKQSNNGWRGNRKESKSS